MKAEYRMEAIAMERGYSIKQNGDFLNPRGKSVGKSINSQYKCLCLNVEGKRKKVLLHRFQAYTKYGSKIYDEGIVVRHKNEINWIIPMIIY